jgi:hypothetical protein
MNQGESGDVSANITGVVSGQIAVGNQITQSWVGPRPESRSVRPSPVPPDPSQLPDINVFISYRRDDAEGHAGRLRDWLVRRFGEERVFQDVDGIEPGEDFVDKLGQKLAECHVLLAVIGRQWLAAVDAAGARRIDDPRDWVRLEIKMALERGVTVIPVLVRGAKMPSEADLPEPLAPLARRNAIEIGPQWAADVRRLADAIERAAERTAKPNRPNWDHETGP